MNTQLISPWNLEHSVFHSGAQGKHSSVAAISGHAHILPCVVLSDVPRNLLSWNLKFLVTAQDTAAQILQKNPAVIRSTVKAQELSWLDLLYWINIWLATLLVKSSDFTGKSTHPQEMGLNSVLCLLQCKLWKELDPGEATAQTLILLFRGARYTLLMFLRSHQSKARFPGIRRKGQNYLLNTHGRQMRKQPPLWMLTLSFLELVQLLGMLGFHAKRLKKTSDFIQVCLS